MKLAWTVIVTIVVGFLITGMEFRTKRGQIQESNPMGMCSAEYTAEQILDYVSLIAKGQHESSGYTTFLSKTSSGLPPSFTLHCFRDSNTVINSVITPFEVTASFRFESVVTEIAIHDLDGDHLVPVVNIDVDQNKLECVDASSREWHGHISYKPPKPDPIYIYGEIEVPNAGVRAVLLEKSPAGINPDVLLLELLLVRSPDPAIQVFTWVEATFQKDVMGDYKSAKIFCGDQVIADFPVVRAQ